jgi:DNA polymerase-3 subunit alpha
MERLAEEFKAVGFYLSGHPLDEYATILPKLNALPYAEFEKKVGFGTHAGSLAAIVVSARERRSQKGNKFAFAMFSDATGQFEAVIFSDTLARCGSLLEPGTAVLVSVEAERDGETLKLRVQGLEALDTAAANVQRGLHLMLDGRQLSGAGIPAKLADIRKHLKPGGRSEVKLSMEVAGVAGVAGSRLIELKLPGRYEIGPKERGEIATVPGVIEVVEI